MARIGTYSNDVNLTRKDKVLGTDSSGSVTINYTLDSLANFLSSRGLVAVGGQVMYQFGTAQSAGKFTGVAGNTAFSSVTLLKFNQIDQSEQDISNFIEEYSGNKIILSQTDDKDVYGIYNVDSVTKPSGQNFFNITLTAESTNGVLTLDKYYVISFAGAGDKHFVHNQGQARQTWTIQHNLGKYPSVSAVLSTGQKGYGDVNYISKNSLTITFTGAESGKAYMN